MFCGATKSWKSLNFLYHTCPLEPHADLQLSECAFTEILQRPDLVPVGDQAEPAADRHQVWILGRAQVQHLGGRLCHFFRSKLWLVLHGHVGLHLHGPRPPRSHSQLWQVKNGPIPASFNVYFRLFQILQFIDNWWKDRFWAWDENTGQQNGRCSWIHWAS